jgi:hypothetical protein
MIDAWNRSRLLQLNRNDFTQRPKTWSGSREREERKEKLHEKLDDALERGLEETFPGSDPVAVTQPPHTVRDKRDV